MENRKVIVIISLLLFMTTVHSNPVITLNIDFLLFNYSSLIELHPMK